MIKYILLLFFDLNSFFIFSSFLYLYIFLRATRLVEEIFSERQAAEARVESLFSRVTSLEAQNQALIGETNAKSASIDSLRSHISNLQAALTKTSLLAASVSTPTSSPSSDRVMSLLAEVAALRLRLEVVEKELSESQSRDAAKSTLLLQAQDLATAQQKELRSLSSARDELQKTVAALRRSLESSGLSSSQTLSRVERAERAATAAEFTAKTLNAENQALREELASLRTVLSSREAEAGSLLLRLQEKQSSAMNDRTLRQRLHAQLWGRGVDYAKELSLQRAIKISEAIITGLQADKDTLVRSLVEERASRESALATARDGAKDDFSMARKLHEQADEQAQKQRMAAEKATQEVARDALSLHEQATKWKALAEAREKELEQAQNVEELLRERIGALRRVTETLRNKLRRGEEGVKERSEEDVDPVQKAAQSLGISLLRGFTGDASGVGTQRQVLAALYQRGQQSVMFSAICDVMNPRGGLEQRLIILSEDGLFVMRSVKGEISGKTIASFGDVAVEQFLWSRGLTHATLLRGRGDVLALHHRDKIDLLLVSDKRDEILFGLMLQRLRTIEGGDTEGDPDSEQDGSVNATPEAVFQRETLPIHAGSDLLLSLEGQGSQMKHLSLDSSLALVVSSGPFNV